MRVSLYTRRHSDTRRPERRLTYKALSRISELRESCFGYLLEGLAAYRYRFYPFLVAKELFTGSSSPYGTPRNYVSDMNTLAQMALPEKPPCSSQIRRIPTCWTRSLARSKRERGN